jgi:hypothetical protein
MYLASSDLPTDTKYLGLSGMYLIMAKHNMTHAISTITKKYIKFLEIPQKYTAMNITAKASIA